MNFKKTLIGLVLLAPLTACQLDQLASPQAMDRIEAAEAARDEADKRTKQAEAKAFATGNRLKAALATGNMLEMQREGSQLRVELAELEGHIAEGEVKQAVVDEAFTEAKDSATIPLLSSIAPFLPAPLKPFLPLTSTLVLPLLFRRGRENLGRGVKSAVKGNVVGALRGILASIGAAHSNGSSEEVLAAAASVLRKESGDSTEAEAKIAALAKEISDAKIDAEAASKKA